MDLKLKKNCDSEVSHIGITERRLVLDTVFILFYPVIISISIFRFLILN